jgi:hypothetical protein
MTRWVGLCFRDPTPSVRTLRGREKSRDATHERKHMLPEKQVKVARKEIVGDDLSQASIDTVGSISGGIKKLLEDLQIQPDLRGPVQK